MTRGSAAKKVARAAAAGRTSKVRGEIPVGFYLSVFLIAVIGIGLIGYSRYQRQHPVVVAAIQPTVGTTWSTAIGFDVCGKQLPNLPAQAVATNLGLYTQGNGVITVAPKTSAQAGNAATLGAFVKGYKGLSIGTKGFTYPGKGSYSTGYSCGGKSATYAVYSWPTLLSNTPVLISNPTAHKLANDELIMVSVLPSGTKVQKPASEVALINSAVNNTTTTTSPAGIGTTVPSLATTTTLAKSSTGSTSTTAAGNSASSTSTTTAG